MIRLKKYSYFIILGIVFLCSCTKDFLKVKDNTGVIYEDQFWTKPDDALKTLVGTYSVVKYNGLYGIYLLYMFNGMDPDVTNEGSNYSKYEKLIFYADDTYVNYAYSQLYAGLTRANRALEKIPLCYADPKYSNDPTLLAERDVIIGEIYFLRAFYCYNITTLFYDPPLVTKILTSDEYNTQKNTAQNLWFESIRKDLHQAINQLPDKWDDANLGRATKGAAYALLGKTFMNAQMWDSAEWAFNKLIVEKTGSYQLIQPLGNDSLDYVYAYLCNYSLKTLTTKSGSYPAENNQESIFEAQNAEEGSTSWNLFLDGYGCDGSLINSYFSFIGYWNIGAKNTFVSQFEKVNPTPGMPLHYDARKYASVYVPGDTIRCWENVHPYCNQRINSIIVDNDTAHPINKLVKAWTAPEGGVTIKKYMFPLYPYTDRNMKTDPNNYRIMTYSDVLLAAAETKYQLNKDAEAVGYLNQLRERVGLRDTTASGTALRDLIISEFRKEKGLEAKLMIETMRWARTKNQRTGDPYFVDPTSIKPEFKRNKNEYLPIPRSEIDYMTQGNINQNIGW